MTPADVSLMALAVAVFALCSYGAYRAARPVEDRETAKIMASAARALQEIGRRQG